MQFFIVNYYFFNYILVVLYMCEICCNSFWLCRNKNIFGTITEKQFCSPILSVPYFISECATNVSFIKFRIEAILFMQF
jgi:hypothetical protein